MRGFLWASLSVEFSAFFALLGGLSVNNCLLHFRSLARIFSKCMNRRRFAKIITKDDGFFPK